MMIERVFRHAAVFPFSLLLLLSCHHVPAPADAPTVFLPLRGMSGYVRIIHEVTFRRKDITLSGRGVLVRRGNMLELLILSPFNTKLLHIRRNGADIETLYHSPTLPLPDPAYILRDVQLIFLTFSSSQPSATKNSMTYKLGGYTITDAFDKNHRLIKRHIRNHRTVDITIQYRPSHRSTGPDFFREALLKDKNAGYTLNIVIDSWEQSDQYMPPSTTNTCPVM